MTLVIIIVKLLANYVYKYCYWCRITHNHSGKRTHTTIYIRAKRRWNVVIDKEMELKIIQTLFPSIFLYVRRHKKVHDW